MNLFYCDFVMARFLFSEKEASGSKEGGMLQRGPRVEMLPLMSVCPGVLGITLAYLETFGL